MAHIERRVRCRTCGGPFRAGSCQRCGRNRGQVPTAPATSTRTGRIAPRASPARWTPSGSWPRWRAASCKEPGPTRREARSPSRPGSRHGGRPRPTCGPPPGRGTRPTSARSCCRASAGPRWPRSASRTSRRGSPSCPGGASSRPPWSRRTSSSGARSPLPSTPTWSPGRPAGPCGCPRWSERRCGSSRRSRSPAWPTRSTRATGRWCCWAPTGACGSGS
jgi:hypothetical protein